MMFEEQLYLAGRWSATEKAKEKYSRKKRRLNKPLYWQSEMPALGSQLNLINRKRSSHGLGSWWTRKMVGRLNLYKHKLLLLILVCILTGCASSRVEEFRAAETGMALE